MPGVLFSSIVLFHCDSLSIVHGIVLHRKAFAIGNLLPNVKNTFSLDLCFWKLYFSIIKVKGNEFETYRIWNLREFYLEFRKRSLYVILFSWQKWIFYEEIHFQSFNPIIRYSNLFNSYVKCKYLRAEKCLNNIF